MMKGTNTVRMCHAEMRQAVGHYLREKVMQKEYLFDVTGVDYQQPQRDFVITLTEAPPAKAKNPE